MAITAFKVIQGYRRRYQSKARIYINLLFTKKLVAHTKKNTKSKLKLT